MIKSKSYTLKTKAEYWLGQVVITSDGFFGAVTDYGNFSYAWRSFGDKTLDNFENFILDLGNEYLATKLVSGFSYICHNKKIEAGAKLFSEKILPALKEEILKQRETKSVDPLKD